MKTKTVKVVNEDTLEIEELEVPVTDVSDNNTIEDWKKDIIDGLVCSPEEFSQTYKEYKRAKEKFDQIFELTKGNLLGIYKSNKDLPSTVRIGDAKLTYVSPSVRTSIDTKKLKEEMPDIAKKFTKTTNVNATIRLS